MSKSKSVRKTAERGLLTKRRRGKLWNKKTTTTTTTTSKDIPSSESEDDEEPTLLQQLEDKIIACDEQVARVEMFTVELKRIKQDVVNTEDDIIAAKLGLDKLKIERKELETAVEVERFEKDQEAQQIKQAQTVKQLQTARDQAMLDAEEAKRKNKEYMEEAKRLQAELDDIQGVKRPSTTMMSSTTKMIKIDSCESSPCGTPKQSASQTTPHMTPFSMSSTFIPMNKSDSQHTVVVNWGNVEENISTYNEARAFAESIRF